MGPHAGTDPDGIDVDDDDDDDVDVDDDLSQFLSRPLPTSAYASRDKYTGSLGYGRDGDACMYRVYPKLAHRCKAAITELYDFREEYVESNPVMMSSSPYHYVKHHNPVVAISFVTLLVLALFVTFKKRQKNQQIRRVLDVIDGNPSLKAQVEGLAGCDIPLHNSGWKDCKHSHTTRSQSLT